RLKALGAMTKRLASCSCGKLIVGTQGEPIRVSICHCLACQKRTGSVFGAQARFPADAVIVEGQSREYVRIGDEGSSVRFHFCPECGSTVFYRFDAIPDVVAVTVGAFADPDFPRPRVSVYEARQHHWVRLPDGIDHLD
ncbi:GFA family protein, partial [Luteimonas salinilitoris]